MVAVLIYVQLVTENFAKGHMVKSNRVITTQRRSGSNGYVDFGAHTGPQGSYGWYADFPVNKN